MPGASGSLTETWVRVEVSTPAGLPTVPAKLPASLLIIAISSLLSRAGFGSGPA